MQLSWGDWFHFQEYKLILVSRHQLWTTGNYHFCFSPTDAIQVQDHVQVTTQLSKAIHWRAKRLDAAFWEVSSSDVLNQRADEESQPAVLLCQLIGFGQRDHLLVYLRGRHHTGHGWDSCFQFSHIHFFKGAWERLKGGFIIVLWCQHRKNHQKCLSWSFFGFYTDLVSFDAHLTTTWRLYADWPSCLPCTSMIMWLRVLN